MKINKKHLKLSLTVLILLFSMLHLIQLEGIKPVSAYENAHFEQYANMTYARLFASVGIVDGKIYVIGGRLGATRLNATEEYNISTGVWTTKTPMPEVKDAMWTGVVNDAIYIISGLGYYSNGTLINRAYFPANDSWSDVLAPKPHTGWDGAGVVITDPIGNEVIYCLGGSTDSNAKKWVEVYCPNNNTWIAKADMIYERAKFGAAVHDGKIYAFGGNWAIPCNKSEVYDPLSNIWTEKAEVPVTAGSYVITLGKTSIFEKIYLLVNVAPIDYVLAYNPETDSYSYFCEAPFNLTPSLDLVEWQGIVYIAGGQDTFSYLETLHGFFLTYYYITFYKNDGVFSVNGVPISNTTVIGYPLGAVLVLEGSGWTKYYWFGNFTFSYGGSSESNPCSHTVTHDDNYSIWLYHKWFPSAYSPDFPSTPSALQYLVNGDYLGFINSIFTSQMGETFYAFIMLICYVGLYLRLKSIVIPLIAWTLMGGFWIGMAPSVSPFVALFWIIGIGGGVLFAVFGRGSEN